MPRIEASDYVYDFDTGLYRAKDIQFINTSELTEAARHFKKHGCYTKAPPGSQDYKLFWDREEERRIKGMRIPGRLVYRDGKPEIDYIRITGEHYGFLNYARILRTEDTQDNLVHRKLKYQKKSARKIVDFPDFLDGQYHYFRIKEFARRYGKHLIVAKARRKGFSYMEAWDSADTINLYPNVSVLLGAFDLKYLTKGNQLMGMAKNYIAFLEKYTDWNRGILNITKEGVQLGYIPQGGKTPEGYLSQIVALSFGNNPDAAIGKDADKIKLEECGKFPNLLQALEVTLSTMEDGDVQTGQLVMFGTGGTEDANWADFESIFYDPIRYNCLGFVNIWDEDTNPDDAVGFFFPHDLCQFPYIDEYGNTVIEKSKEATNRNREINKNNAKSNAEHLSYISQRANSPREAFTNSSNNIFPSAEIISQIAYCKSNSNIKHLARNGQIIYETNDKGSSYPIFRTNRYLESKGIKVHEPIEYPFKKDADLHGCVTEYFSPYKSEDGTVPEDLYEIWYDPYGVDKKAENFGLGDSLGCAFVYERPNNFTNTRGDIIVAEIIGRRDTMEDFDLDVFKLAEYWNCKILVEVNRGETVSNARKHHKLHLLAETPGMSWDTSLKTNLSRTYGLHIDDTLKPKGALYLKQWMLKTRGKTGNDEVKRNLNYIYSLFFLNQLLKWNEKGNFDAVSTGIIGMFGVKEFEVMGTTVNNNAHDMYDSLDALDLFS